MSTYQNKTIQRLCKLGCDDLLVMVNMQREMRDFLSIKAKQKGLTLSQECYLRLCASVERDVPRFSFEDVEEQSDLDLYELIFNKELAIDERKLVERGQYD